MKKLLSVILISALVLIALTSCGGSIAGEGTATVVIEGAPSTDSISTEVFEIELSELEARNEGALSLIKHLKSRGKLEYSVTEGPYGAYIDTIGVLIPETSAGEYIGVYTSESADRSTVMPGEASYKGISLAASGVGISSMKIEDGTVILFRIDKY